MKKVLVSAYIGFGNFGDEAIFCALADYLKSSGFEVSVLCSNTKKVAKDYNVNAFYFKSLKEVLFSLFKTDLLISGGGSLLQNKTSNFSLYYYLFILFLAKILNKKTIIFAQGIEPIKGLFSLFITKMVLGCVDFISVRDKKSQDLLKTWKINSTLVSDPVYSLIQDRKIYPDKSGLVVQLRNCLNLKPEFLPVLASSIAKNYSGKVSVFSFQKDYDEEICKNFVKCLKDCQIEAEYISNTDINETIEILNKAQFVISTRLHGLIVANALKSNVFALVYDDKIQTLVDELNIPCIDLLQAEKNQLDLKLDAFFNHHLNEVHPYRRFDWDFLDVVIKKKEKICS